MRVRILLRGVFVLALCACSVLLHSTLVMAEGNLTAAAQDYETDLQKVKTITASKNVTMVDQNILKLEAKWRQKDELSYFRFMDEVCMEIGQSKLNDLERRSLREKYASLVLSGLRQVPIVMKTQFIEHLGYVPQPKSALETRNWSKLRTARAKLWLQEYSEIAESDSSIDAYQQPGVMPSLEIILNPNHTVKDDEEYEKRRAKFDADMRQAQKDTDEYEKKKMFRSLKISFLPRAEKYISNAYSQGDENSPELAKYLNLYVSDRAAREKILKMMWERRRFNQTLSAP